MRSPRFSSISLITLFAGSLLLLHEVTNINAPEKNIFITCAFINYFKVFLK